MSSCYEVSVVLPFGDDEDAIGPAVQRLASELRTLGLSFEILAVDEDSGDNSHAVLALQRARVPELRVIHAPRRGRGADAGAARAQGRVLWIIDPHKVLGPMAGATEAILSVRDGAVDAVVMHDAFIVANRVRALPATTGLRGFRDARQRRLARRLAAGGLRIDVQQVEAASAARPRWFSAFLPRRAPSSTTRPS
ncbi:MAG: glycosyltransferase [Myxococcales bacterium]|nr:glycosyltransferase [Myxococcales bacterium]